MVNEEMDKILKESDQWSKKQRQLLLVMLAKDCPSYKGNVMLKYQEKDKVKFNVCNKLISRGAPGSSSHKYATQNTFEWLDVNAEEYKVNDTVGISVNGARRGRQDFDRELVLKAIEARVTFIIDSDSHAKRQFNLGERDVRKFLLDNGYVQLDNQKWRSQWVPNEKVEVAK